MYLLCYINFSLFVCLFVVVTAPGDLGGMLNVFRPPGPMGPRGVQGPLMRPDMAPHFQGPGGPRQGPPIGPLFPGPEGGPMMGPRMRGLMPPRMQGGPGVGRGMVSGPRPLLPEMVSCDVYLAIIRHFKSFKNSNMSKRSTICVPGCCEVPHKSVADGWMLFR